MANSGSHLNVLQLWPTVSIISITVREKKCSRTLASFRTVRDHCKNFRNASKFFEAVINKKIIENLNVNKPVSDKHDVFRFSMATSNVLTIATHRINEAFDNKRVPS